MFDEEYPEEYQAQIWKAGEIVPAGTYVRIDQQSYRLVTLDCEGPLPATFDDHVACYRTLPKIEIKHVEQRLVMVC
jgi:hypothetical protein